MKFVINHRGEKEKFSPAKVYESARRSGASKKLAKEITKEITSSVSSGAKTGEIYARIISRLKKEKPDSAIRFSLKQSLSDLGPTGFPFEKFVGALFSERGYKVRLNSYIKGECLEHEIDFTAEKRNLFYIGECKFRNLEDAIVHSPEVFINYARFLDIKNGVFYGKLKKKGLKVKSILATNTKFSKRAKIYCSHYGVDVLGWRIPKGGELETIIEEKKLYPITILPSLSEEVAKIFFERDKILAKDVLKTENIGGVEKNLLLSLKKEAEIVLHD